MEDESDDQELGQENLQDALEQGKRSIKSIDKSTKITSASTS